MFVKVDVRVEKIRNCLPGANCGACGFSSCEGYAEALAKGEVASNLCLPAGESGYERINTILGINAGEGLAKMTAIVRCLGDKNTMKNKMEYVGEETCFAAKQLFGGQGSCTFGCLGYGDCVSVCPSEAICVEGRLARIDPRRCSGCAVCAKVCPTGVISIEAEPVYVSVMCMNTEKGAVLKEKCSRGCIGCMKCVKICPAKTITVNESLAVIDHTLCYGCRECVDVCIVKCIV
jgi:Na+-translocating ferredoxin:NAD+ oxidoreductase RNF subunit RnfB